MSSDQNPEEDYQKLIQSLTTHHSDQIINQISSSSILENINRTQQFELKIQLSKTIHHSIKMFLKLPKTTTEDKLMNEELRKVNDYLNRIINKSNLDKSRMRIERESNKRLINSSIDQPSSSSSSSNKQRRTIPSSNGHSHCSSHHLNHDHQEQNAVLPVIRKVIKNPTDGHSDDDDDDDGDLKVYN